MSAEANVAAIYHDHDAAQQAVAKLRDASFDVTKLLIIGKDYHGIGVGSDGGWPFSTQGRTHPLLIANSTADEPSRARLILGDVPAA